MAGATLVPDIDKMTLPEKVVEYIGYTSATLEKASALENRVRGQQTKVAALIPAAVDALVANGRIREDQRKEAAARLADPVATLELLTKVAAHRTPDEHAKLGNGVGSVKTAGAGQHNPASSLTNPHVGARSSMVKQSDVNLFTRLGLTPPTN